jgi:hypothetical protein
MKISRSNQCLKRLRAAFTWAILVASAWGCRKQPTIDSTANGTTLQCISQSALNQRIQTKLSYPLQNARCATIPCRLGRVLTLVRAETLNHHICPQSPLDSTVGFSSERLGEFLTWVADQPQAKIPASLPWKTDAGISQNQITDAINRYAPKNGTSAAAEASQGTFPIFPYQIMKIDYVGKNLPKDLMVSYARVEKDGATCRLKYHDDCAIRSFAALSGLSYCDKKDLQFGLKDQVIPSVLAGVVAPAVFSRTWMNQGVGREVSYFGAQELIQGLLQKGGIGSYMIGVNDLTTNSGHVAVLRVAAQGDRIRIVSQDLQLFSQVEGLPVDFRMRLIKSKVFRDQLKKEISQQTNLFQSIVALDNAQQAGQLPELNHSHLGFNVIKISDDPSGIVPSDQLEPFLGALKPTPNK